MPSFARLCLTLACLAGFSAHAAAAYPEKPVKLVVNFVAGGPLDTVARLLAERAAKRLKQPVIVENRAGAGGNIGAEFVARAPKDGYTALITVDHLLTVNPLVYRDMGFDPAKDLVPAGTFGTTSLVLIAHPGLKVKDFRQFVARAAKEELPYASAGLASPGHLTFELLKARANVLGAHVPYKGNAPALSDVVAGHVPLAFVATSNTIQYIRSGALVGLATSSSTRNKQLPEVPTIEELGIPDFDVQFRQVVLFPAGTPADIVQTWEKLIKEELAEPEVLRQLDQMGLMATGTGAQDTAAALRGTRARWQQLIERLGVTMN